MAIGLLSFYPKIAARSTTDNKIMNVWDICWPFWGEVSIEKNLGWLAYIGDYTTQFYRDSNKPL